MIVAPISMPKMMREVTLHVHVVGAKRSAARLWVGSRILKFAAFVIGCEIVIGTGDAVTPVTFDENGIPSRYGVGDRHFDYQYGARLKIHLNGVRQDKVISYDKEIGEVVVWENSERRVKRGLVEVSLLDPVT